MPAPETQPGGTTTFGQHGTRPETLADRAEFLTGGLVPFRCASCETEVLVKKNSEKHTSVQWTTDARTSCPVLARRAGSGGPAAPLDTCERLHASIDEAARAGEFGGADA